MKEESVLVVRIEPVYGRSSKVRVVFDGAMDVCLYPRDLKRLSIDEGSVVSRDELYGFFREVLLPRAKSRALHLLERQDRTRSGLVNKLLEGGYPVDVAEEAVAYVEELGYVDDERYARQYISYHKKQASCRKLGMDLVRRGIDRELADHILEEDYDTDEYGLIRALLDKKHYDAGRADRKEQARMYRYLVSRGFDHSRAREALTAPSYQ